MDLPQHILSVQQSEHIHQALKTCPRYFLSPQEMPLLVCSKQSEFLAPVSAWCAVSEQKTHSSILCSIITSELCKLSLEVPRWSVLCSAAAAVRSDCPGPCPVEFWIYTRIEILQALWSPPAFRHSCDLKAKKTPFICCLNGFFLLPDADLYSTLLTSLALSFLHPPRRWLKVGILLIVLFLCNTRVVDSITRDLLNSE